jgi:hypothetical protein
VFVLVRRPSSVVLGLAVRINGRGESFHGHLEPGHKDIGAPFNRFGICTP